MQIGYKMWTDHAWINCVVKIDFSQNKSKTWSLDNSLLKEEVSFQQIACHLIHYFLDDDNNEVSPLIL